MKIKGRADSIFNINLRYMEWYDLNFIKKYRFKL